jgi:hypothetical protein
MKDTTHALTFLIHIPQPTAKTNIKQQQKNQPEKLQQNTEQETAESEYQS